MTDYEEEQRHEIEAIESIYPEEFTIISESAPHSFQIHLESSCEDKEDNTIITVSVQLQFTFVEKYPDEAPVVEVTSSEGLEDDDINQLTELLVQQSEENLGMVMVFTLVSCAQEKLEEIAEGIKKHRQEERIRKQKEVEEAEKRKFTGTPVSKESFAAWKMKFDLEMAEKNKGKTVVVTKSKITGRKLFEMDASLVNSDSAFLEGEPADVEVDESLFQEMEDLELDEELS
ncbi:RWD domain-containing protein 1 [Nematostella vectensis]|uniref:RWD domain-containing protein 1 n=1 Tax=Nematostella vectensis TaxID=45351 RepID=UPI0020773B54|nr:RWD domain-containing protein 1 [Nematostella vectensis]